MKDYKDLISVLSDDIAYYKDQKRKLIREREIASAQIVMYENMIHIGEIKPKEYEENANKKRKH